MELELSTVFDAAFEAGIAVSSGSIEKSLTFHDWYAEEHDVSRRLLVGVPLRASIAWRPARAFSLELGALGGVAWSRSKSTQCGERSVEIAPLLGGFFGPMIHFGARDEFAAGAQVQAVLPGQLRCTNSGEDPVTRLPLPNWFDDDEPDPMIVGQFVYVFGR